MRHDCRIRMKTFRCLPIVAVFLAFHGVSVEAANASSPSFTNGQSWLAIPADNESGIGGWTLKRLSQESPRPPFGILGGSVDSDVDQPAKTTNQSIKLLDSRFFQYGDLDFGGFYVGDTVRLGQEAAGLFSSNHENKQGGFLAEEIQSSGDRQPPVGLYPSIYNELRGRFPGSFNWSNRPVNGDAAWAFQWDASIPVGGSSGSALGKSTFLTSVPEPTALALIALGLTLLGACARRRAE